MELHAKGLVRENRSPRARDPQAGGLTSIRFRQHSARRDWRGIRGEGFEMTIVDMSDVMNVHTPGWGGYAGNKMYYAHNLQTQMTAAHRIAPALHVGADFDGAMHATDTRKCHSAS